MPGLLDIPVELRLKIYDCLLHDHPEPRPRGVMIISEKCVREHLPLSCYRGLLRVCRQIYIEFLEAIRHMSSTGQLVYELSITFSHGRPYYSVAWIKFPALYPTINSITIHVYLRLREPFSEVPSAISFPTDHELEHLVSDDIPGNFAHQLFDYIAVLLKTLAFLLYREHPSSFVLVFVEVVVINLRTPTHMVSRGFPSPRYSATDASRYHILPLLVAARIEDPPRLEKVDRWEASALDLAMRHTLEANARGFEALNACHCCTLSPHIQIGSLRCATEGSVWGEGHNLVLVDEDFMWLIYRVHVSCVGTDESGD